MDFFLQIHNGEWCLGGHFCDQQRDHGPSVLIENITFLSSLQHLISWSHPETISTQAEHWTQNQNKNAGGGIEQGELHYITITLLILQQHL